MFSVNRSVFKMTKRVFLFLNNSLSSLTLLANLCLGPLHGFLDAVLIGHIQQDSLQIRSRDPLQVISSLFCETASQHSETFTVKLLTQQVTKPRVTASDKDIFIFDVFNLQAVSVQPHEYPQHHEGNTDVQPSIFSERTGEKQDLTIRK